jgi:hypothetical protein
MAISEDRFELNLERAAHRETRAHLARMTQAVQYWHAKATGGHGPATDGVPIPITTPVPAGGGGGQLLVVVVDLMKATAELASQLAMQQGGGTPGPEAEGWVRSIQTRLDQLVAALPAGTGATPTGGQRGYPPTQPQNPGPQKKQGEHPTTPPTAQFPEENPPIPVEKRETQFPPK